MRVEPSAPTRRTASLCLAVGAPALALLYVLAANAWIVDDAYITFRSIENLAAGHGLRWNVDERVQVFTHPLWLLVVAALHAVTSEFYLTALTACLVCTLLATGSLAGLQTGGLRRDLWRIPLYCLILASSKAVIDYASSGLENALSYLIAALFGLCLLAPGGQTPGRLAGLVGLAALAFLNRQDTLLLYAPALLWWIAAHGRGLSRGAWLRAVLAGLPAVAWLGFALLYFGHPFPNTSYAKLTATGFPAEWRIARGLEYLADSLTWDFPLYGLLLAGIALALRRRRPALLALHAGVLAYLVYVVVYAASATHLSGRFAALPLFVAASLFPLMLDERRWAGGIALALLAFNLANPAAAIKFGTRFYDSDVTLFRQRPLTPSERLAARSHIDAKNYIYPDYVPLVSNWRPGATYGPDNLWYQGGLALRRSGQRVHAGGFLNGEAVGYFGFAAGPEKFIVDRVGLTDPLLSKLPAIRPERFEEWKSGHFLRLIPFGYLESVAADRNLVRDPSLHRYYDAIRLVTRGPLLEPDRLREIWRLNTGAYDSLIEDYRRGEVAARLRARERSQRAR
jgi:arabinofuranosyltransferase